MIYTFSTKGTKPADTELVKAVKQHCSDTNMNFSGLVLTLLRNYLDGVNAAKGSPNGQ